MLSTESGNAVIIVPGTRRLNVEDDSVICASSKPADEDSENKYLVKADLISEGSRQSLWQGVDVTDDIECDTLTADGGDYILEFLVIFHEAATVNVINRVTKPDGSPHGNVQSIPIKGEAGDVRATVVNVFMDA